MTQTMHNDRYLDLCNRILERCYQRNWYGPDSHMGGFIGSFYDNATLQSREFKHDPRAGFEFPPATEAQLQMTEELMGFAHPPLLRTLYLQVANGGFGPDTGIIGALGGFCYWVHQDPRYTTMIKEELIQEYGETFCQENFSTLFDTIDFDLEQFEKDHENPKLIRLSEREWPTYFLHLCEWQSEDAFYIHGKSENLYIVTSGFGKTLKGESAFHCLHRQDGSLENLLEHWLDGTLQAQYYEI